MHRQGTLAEGESGAADCGFDASGDYKGKSAFVVDGNPGVLDTKFIKDSVGLVENCLPVVGCHARFE